MKNVLSTNVCLRKRNFYFEKNQGQNRNADHLQSPLSEVRSVCQKSATFCSAYLFNPLSRRWFVWQIDSVLKIPAKQQVFGCVHTSGGVTIFSLYDRHMLDIRQINDWTKETSAASLVWVSLAGASIPQDWWRNCNCPLLPALCPPSFYHFYLFFTLSSLF